MEFTDFIHRADDLIDRLAPRIDRDEASFIRRAARAGEWGEAIDDLIATLATEHTSITTAEKTDLLELLSYMKWPHTKLDGITVTAPPAGTI